MGRGLVIQGRSSQAIKLRLCGGDAGHICDSNTAGHSDGGTEGDNGGGPPWKMLRESWSVPMTNHPHRQKVHTLEITQFSILTAVTVTPHVHCEDQAQSDVLDDTERQAEGRCPGSGASFPPSRPAHRVAPRTCQVSGSPTHVWAQPRL